MPRSPAKSLTSTAASPPDTSLDPPRDAVAGRLAARHARDLIAAGLLLILAGLLGSALAVALTPSHGTGWATLVPLLIAGVGGGMIVAPNQSLSLSRVPLPEAGAAAGLLQTGQRLGTSAGIAAAGAAFFATLHGHGSYASAYRNGVLVTAAITAVALILTLTDRHRAARVHADQGDHWHHEH